MADITFEQRVQAIAVFEKRADTVVNVSYCGKAPFGSTNSAAVWTIKKITIASNGTATTLSASSAIWDDRLTTIYS
jgi:hypothetical protein